MKGPSRPKAASPRSAGLPPGKTSGVLMDCLAAAGKILRRRFGKVTVSEKRRADLLTEADLESQREVLRLIRSSFPEHAVLAEEDQPEAAPVPRDARGHLWVVDPLDGTTNYAHGFPVFCTSIALLKDGRPVLAGIYDPMRDECFTAARGRGAYLNGRRMRVSGTARLYSSLLITGFPYDRARRGAYYTAFYRRFLDLCRDIRRSGSAALDMAWVAAGRADGFWEFKLNPWDVAAGLLLVSEAGGKVTDFSGRVWPKTSSFGRQTLATNGRLHHAMRRVIKERL